MWLTNDIKSVFKGHVDDVYSVSFSPDGSTLASGSGDGTVLLWEISVPKQLKEDINGDGVVNIQDLVLVAAKFGQIGENKADVNGDGFVNIQDIVVVAAAFSNAFAASTIRRDASKHLTQKSCSSGLMLPNDWRAPILLYTVVLPCWKLSSPH